MFTDFLYVLLTIWTRLQTKTGGTCLAIQACVSGRIHNLCQLNCITSIISLPESREFPQTANLRVSTSTTHFSPHSTLFENSLFDRWQTIFRWTIFLPLFGTQWPLNRACFGAGTV